MQVFIKLMVNLDAAELLSQINELGKLVRMCLFVTSGLGAPESPNRKPSSGTAVWPVSDALMQGNLNCDSKT